MKFISSLLLFLVSSGFCEVYPQKMPKHWHECGSLKDKITGGLGGKVIKVTNLNSSGSGSLNAALGAGGKRLIVFEVGGVIEGVGGVGSNVTIAGQTAPYPGITIIKGTLGIGGSNVVVSHIAVRVGDFKGAPDGIEILGHDVVLDHVISSWGVDETVTLKGSDNITLFKCVVAEALSNSNHGEGEHSKGNLIFRVCDPVYIIGCLYAHSRMRNPRISDSRVLMTNSVVYAPAPGKDDSKELWNYFVHVGDNGEQSIIPEVTFMGNVGLHGPDTDEKARYLIHGHKNEKGKAYMKDNIIQDREGKNLEITDESIIPLDEKPIWSEGLEVIPAHESLYEVLRTVGPQPGQREDVTKRIVKSVADCTGHIIDSQDDVGGYPSYPETRRSLTVPEGAKAQQDWLDSLEDVIAVDTTMDLSRYYGRIGTQASDTYVNKPIGIFRSKSGSPRMEILLGPPEKKQFHIALTLPAANTVRITILDVAGNVAARQSPKSYQTGKHKIAVNVRHLAAGRYLCRLHIGNTILSQSVPLGI